ncbi:MAG TPA: hypothetical protein VM427_07230 [Patescibacteria group bacterium]|nr:hypothetical protein [Patescibacteria group bacterium]
MSSSPTPIEIEPAPAGSMAARSDDLVLARTHLRLGLLGLARTELETLAGQGSLDDEAIRDLAEARWRTGDIGGAGEAAAVCLDQHPNDILGLVIAAEAQAALGRPAEARRLAGRALEAADGSLDPVFAGMQRSAIWPVEPGTSVGQTGVLFDDLHPGPRPLAGSANGPGSRSARGPDAGVAHEPFEPGVPDVFGSPSLWGDDADGSDAALADALDPTILFHRGRVALEAGRTAEAATGLILALRSTPGLAPAVLDLLAGRSDPILVLVRGDAQRIVGHETEAMRDHAAAAGAIGGDPADDGRGPADDRRGPTEPQHPSNSDPHPQETP